MSFLKRLFGKNKNSEQEEVVEHPIQNEQLEVEEHPTDQEVPVQESQEGAEEVLEDVIIEEILEKVSKGELEEVYPVVEELVDEVAEDLETLEQLEETPESTELEETMEEVVEEVPVEEKKKGFIKRLFSGLSKTRDSILKGVDEVLSNFKHIDEDLYEELEETLIMADFGVDTTLYMMEELRKKVKEEKITDPTALKGVLERIISDLLMDQPHDDIISQDGPSVILVIGVNGVGKTTSIGKMSHLFKSQNKKVLVAAADTFRAAAIEQLQVWTERAGVEIIKHDEGSDAAAVVFDAISAAKSRKADVLICDTAGRLQNKTNLMKELEKISRIIAREYPEAKKEILIVLDATTGQNAIQQVKLFKEVADINGIILTKLDGTAKGGAIVGIYKSLQVPVKYIGVGEKIDDLQPFDAQAFARALFEAE